MEKILFLIFIVYFSTPILSQHVQPDISRSARLVEPNVYFAQLVQETIYELERRQWCNFKMDDFTEDLNDLTHTNLLVRGQAEYTNGFLVSIQKIDVTSMLGSTTFTIDPETNITITRGSVRGLVNFRDMEIGYDVATNLTDDNQIRRYTGIFKHTLFQVQYTVIKNFNTDEVTVSWMNNGLSGGSGVRMVYMPEDEISEVMSLRFTANRNSNSVRSWITDIIVPLMEDIAKTKIPFPEVCLSC